MHLTCHHISDGSFQEEMSLNRHPHYRRPATFLVLIHFLSFETKVIHWNQPHKLPIHLLLQLINLKPKVISKYCILLFQEVYTNINCLKMYIMLILPSFCIASIPTLPCFTIGRFSTL